MGDGSQWWGASTSHLSEGQLWAFGMSRLEEETRGAKDGVDERERVDSSKADMEEVGKDSSGGRRSEKALTKRHVEMTHPQSASGTWWARWSSPHREAAP